MNEQLLRLPHRQFVFTFLPKLLRVFFRHDRRLYGEIRRLIYRLVCEFTSNAAGRKLRTGAVIALHSSGEFAR